MGPSEETSWTAFTSRHFSRWKLPSEVPTMNLVVRLLFLGIGLSVTACGGNHDETPGLACEQNCALNNCPKDAPSSECLVQCEKYVATCPTEANHSLTCRIGLSTGQLVCDPDNGVTTYANSISCAAENSALQVCLSR